jgi:hypothetical protein
MGHTSNTNPTLSKKYGQEFSVDHYQRPLADYFSGLSDAGFIVKNMLEPELTPELLTENPRFETMLDHPVSAIFYAIKQ